MHRVVLLGGVLAMAACSRGKVGAVKGASSDDPGARVPGAIVVDFKDGTTKAEFDAWEKDWGVDLVKGYNFINDDDHPNDDHGHGTHVAGTIASATDNNEGVAGIAFEAALMPLKVLDQSGIGISADIADAIRFATDHGANVIN